MMVKIVLYQEKFKESTIKFILDILENEFRIRGVERPDLDKIPEVYQKGKSNFWLAIDKGEVIGTTALADYGKGRGYLKRIYVKKENRGTGLAKTLLEKLLDFAKRKGYKEIFLGTVKEMIAARKFYLKSGFVKIDYLPEDIPDFGDTEFYVLRL